MKKVMLALFAAAALCTACEQKAEEAPATTPPAAEGTAAEGGEGATAVVIPVDTTETTGAAQ